MAQTKASEAAVKFQRTDKELTLEEIKNIALEDALASKHLKNVQPFVIEDTGPGGPLRVSVPKFSPPRP
jgi:hypothetical protein